MIYKNKKELILSLITGSDTVLDVGFFGQGVQTGSAEWPHALLQKQAALVYGLDLDFGPEYKNNPRYFKASAENFVCPLSFDVIFAGDVIEHLSNPGLFLDSCKRHLKSDGQLIITTPNCFSLFSMTEKITKYEPTVNKDHTCYFNIKTLSQLLEKNGWMVDGVGYVYTLGEYHDESWRKKVLNILYKLLSLVTSKFLETIVIVARPTPRVRIENYHE